VQNAISNKSGRSFAVSCLNLHRFWNSLTYHCLSALFRGFLIFSQWSPFLWMDIDTVSLRFTREWNEIRGFDGTNYRDEWEKNFIEMLRGCGWVIWFLYVKNLFFVKLFLIFMSSPDVLLKFYDFVIINTFFVDGVKLLNVSLHVWHRLRIFHFVLTLKDVWEKFLAIFAYIISSAWEKFSLSVRKFFACHAGHEVKFFLSFRNCASEGNQIKIMQKKFMQAFL
jgi:hypothetical protein